MIGLLLIIAFFAVIILIADLAILKKDKEEYNNCSDKERENYEN